MRLPLTSFVLPNGLRVVVATDRSSPTVAVSVTYRVGSRDERSGKAGFAHLFEHLMAQGTRNLRPREISALIEGNGGVRNAYTMKTNTTYHSVVPTAALELVLWAEADRMHTLHVDERALALEKQVVLEEMRRSYLNQPYRRAQTEGMGEAVFDLWENRHATIGDAADIRDARLDDVRAFYQAHYAPNNAVVALAGDIGAHQTRRLMRKYFGRVPFRPVEPSRDLTEPPLTRDRRMDFPDPLAKLPRLMVAWRAPDRGSRDFWALTILAELLAGGEESPLYCDLVREAKLALSTSAAIPWWTHHTNARGPDAFGIDALLRDGASADAALKRLDGFIKRLSARGPSESEVERAKTQLEFQWLHGLQFQLERARTLSSYAALIGDPRRLAFDLQALASIRRPEVAAAMRRWLPVPGRGIVAVRPVKPSAPEEEPPTPPIPEAAPRARGEAPPPVGPAKPPRSPKIHRFRLRNGLSVLFVRDAKLPLLELRLSMPAGKLAEGPRDSGVSEGAASLLFKGVAGLDAASIARAFARMGFSVGVESRRELAVLSASGLARSAEPFLRLLNRLLTEASYPEREVALWREQTLERMRQVRLDPDFLTGEAMKKALYGDHPYGRPFPSDAELSAIQGASLRAYHRRAFRPGGATLVLVGDLAPETARRLLDRCLGDWPESVPPPLPPPVPAAAAGAPRLLARSGSRQVNLSLAQALPVTSMDEDYPAFVVMNHILGGSSTSRLFLNLRIDKGYTYGSYARAATLSRCATWVASAETRGEVAAAALGEMRGEVDRIRERLVPASELDAAKRHLAGVFAIRLASLEGLAGMLWKLEVDGLPPERELARYVKRLEAVTAEDVRRVARRVFSPEAMVAIAVGEARDLESLNGARKPPAAGERRLARSVGAQ
ncbi:MAG: insulinase family protein [Elusimicrobia bacterium]|nr:insulinase family protein [Elusimicrobiota bacterium]